MRPYAREFLGVSELLPSRKAPTTVYVGVKILSRHTDPNRPTTPPSLCGEPSQERHLKSVASAVSKVVQVEAGERGRPIAENTDEATTFNMRGNLVFQKVPDADAIERSV